MRIIDIFDENKQHRELNSDDLPLELYRLNKNNNKLLIAPLSQQNSTLEKTICGYISHEDDHLFFQPDETHHKNYIFHNNEIIEKSVWLKSGDILQFEQKIITYMVSGDRIELSILNKPEQSINLIAPNKDKGVLINTSYAALSQNTIKEPSSTTKTTKRFILFSLFTLLIMVASFILFAEMAEITISPSADSRHLKGVFPTIKMNNKYILIAGRYVLKADKQGYQSLNATLDINSNNKNFFLTLKENPGFVQFKINPEDNNEIFVDDILLDKKDKDYYEIDKGEHSLTIINPRYKKYQQNIQVEGKNKAQNYTINLQPNWGIVSLNTLQEELQIVISHINNKNDPVYNKRLNTVETIELIAGEYTIDISKEKYKSNQQTLIVNAGEQLNLTPFNLEPEEGILHLNSQPEQSIIRIDGEYFGKTPKTIKLSSYKEHHLELSLTGYKTLQKTIKLEPEEILETNLSFVSNHGLVFISRSPKQAQLMIDGIKQKKSTGTFTLKTGKHRFEMKAKGYQTQIKKITINNSDSKNISFILQKKAPKISHTTYSKSVINKTGNKKASYTNSISQRMIYIRPTTFMMGSKRSESGRSSNERQHKVKITQAYFLSNKEVSNQQFKQFKASHDSGSSAGLSLDSAKQPVVNVSWQEAAQFANWLSQKESLNPYYQKSNGKLIAIAGSSKSNGYRLPFESEWAWVARSNQYTKYPWSGRYPPIQVQANYADISAVSHIANTLLTYNDHFSVSAPIGSYAKNALGFYDIAGNVSEWCHDYYSPTFGLSGIQTAIDPTGPQRGTHYVVRDASWRDASMTELRLSYRSYSKKKANDIGFRLARSTQ